MTPSDPGLQDLVLHVPPALRDRVEEMASRQCLSLNLFVLMAIAEKLQRLQLENSLGASERDEIANAAILFHNNSLVH